MTLKQNFEIVMEQSTNMALATSVENIPNVRIVTFGYNPAQPGHLFFTTFPGNAKIAEFAKNPNVSCMPLPESPEAGIQVRLHGTVKPSASSIEKIAPLLLKKFPAFQETLQAAKDILLVYEVNFSEAFVTVGMAEAQCVSL